MEGGGNAVGVFNQGISLKLAPRLASALMILGPYF